MNRQWTGWLAWSALALVIAVPSADIVFSQPETPELASIETAETDSEQQSFFGPMLPEQNPDLALKPRSTVVIETPSVVEIAEPAPLVLPEPTAILPETPPVIDVVEAPIAIAEKIKPVPMAPSIPLDFRIVGDERMVTALRPVETAPVVIPDETIVVPEETFEISELPQAETIGVPFGEPLPLETARVAPVPMPASMRPVTPVTQTGSFQDDVRQSIETIRTARRDEQPVVLAEDGGERLTLREVQQLQQGPQRLDTINSSGFANNSTVRSNGFSDIREGRERPLGFSRRGSFEEQLPARRGDSVRLDLLQ